MGILDRAVKRGIRAGVSVAVGQAVQKAIEPKATEMANNAAARIDEATYQTTQQTSAASESMNGAFGNLQRAAGNYATEAGKNLKICPSCGTTANASNKFCPSCGTQLPEQTVAEGAVCTSCGTQNVIGTKFCAQCGTKLPAAIAEEQAAQAKIAAVMAEWDRVLPQYPKWSFGGNEMCIEQMEEGYIRFYVRFNNGYDATHEVNQYRALLMQYGFHQAGQYPDLCSLYNRINGICYHASTEHCFEAGYDRVEIYFNIGEPTGGYDYVKPEPKKSTGLKGLFGL